MSYREYVIAAYAVFAIVLLWSFVIPRWLTIMLLFYRWFFRRFLMIGGERR